MGRESGRLSRRRLPAENGRPFSECPSLLPLLQRLAFIFAQPEQARGQTLRPRGLRLGPAAFLPEELSPLPPGPNAFRSALLSPAALCWPLCRCRSSWKASRAAAVAERVSEHLCPCDGVCKCLRHGFILNMFIWMFCKYICISQLAFKCGVRGFFWGGGAGDLEAICNVY